MADTKRKGEGATPTVPPKGKSVTQAKADILIDPAVSSACVVRAFSLDESSDINIGHLIAALIEEGKKSSSGDLDRGKAMLAAQAHALDAVFCTMTKRAAYNLGEHLGATDTYMKLALRAQADSRATWEAIAAISSTKVTNHIA